MRSQRSNRHSTVIDVAKKAGVSPATVSRVLNNSVPVSGDTRDRVFAAVAELGYKHGDAQLQGGTETRIIALLITDILNPFFPEVVRGVTDEAEIHGLASLLYHTAEDPLHEKRILQKLVNRQIDGIIVCASRILNDDLIALHEQHGIPIVVINRRVLHSMIPSIFVDFEDAAYRSAQHLLTLRHTRLAYLAGHEYSESSRDRKRGIERALQEVGLPFPSELCPGSFPSLEGGFQAMTTLLALPATSRPTGIIAYNDLMALGALHAIRTQHLQVPDDISVVGCDGITIAAHSNPPLTTIDQPKYRMGQIAMQMLYRIMNKQFSSSGGYTQMESPLIIRESTGPCPDDYQGDIFSIASKQEDYMGQRRKTADMSSS
ncbi:LacI family transcriptional regulator [Ktedonobacteria bacterium brp13]|nr:LacI family transcriptional regulator [Ktedonobacteria bacterium brp13]